jgi:alpha-beta hydrolase superfamily lysophospholipase
MRARLITTALAGMILLGPPAVAGLTPAQPSVRTDQVCFTVHNDGDLQPSTVYGVRYSTGARALAAPAIVLVHGVSPTHEYWDLRPDFSVARNLAAAGYTVFSYDRLGWGHSPYDRPQGGQRLTLSAAQSMLHEIVGEVKAGSWSAPAEGGCSVAGGEPGGPAIPRVIVIGASAGGAIVSGYPGHFHDVAAAVPVVWSNQGFSPEFSRYFAEAATRGAGTANDYYRLVPDEQSCRRWVLYPAGVNPVFEPAFCRDGYGPAAPAGELTFSGRLVAENLASISRVGAGLPVLLVFADHDAIFPPDHPTAEFGYWKAHCGCDVEGWTASDAGHGLVVHTAMPAFTDKVIGWLAAKGLTP